ncbi:MAG: ribosome silencing factor [Candidatus Omnitrophota bacterium]|nr:MAG: ribosome silencing factor [Candidatus Omnitrophota bacterium]
MKLAGAAAITKKISHSKDRAYKLIEWALAKKANKPVILDVKESCGFCDYFVICSADSSRQVEAICEEIRKKCKEEKIRISHIEKDDLSQWVLIDILDVIFHIFIEEVRDFYNLEYLWKESKKINIPAKKKSFQGKNPLL